MRRIALTLALLQALSCPVAAEPLSQHMPTDFPAITQLLYERAIGYYNNKDYFNALDSFKKLRAMYPEDEEIAGYIASLEEKFGLHYEQRRVARAERREPKPEYLPEKKLEPSAEEPAPIADEPEPPVEQEFVEEEETPREPKREILTSEKRAGFDKYYREGSGLKIAKYVGFQSYVELVEVPRPIESLTLDARYRNLTSKEQFESILTPEYTRAYGGHLVFDYKDWPRLRTTYDYRTTLHQFQAQFGFKDFTEKSASVDLTYPLPRLKYLGQITVNPWYTRKMVVSNGDANSEEKRNEYIVNMTIAPSETIELFGQIDKYEGKHITTPWISKPKNYIYKTELRLRFPEYKFRLTPGYYSTRTKYYPSTEVYTKQEIFVDAGLDFTPKLRGSMRPELFLVRADSGAFGKDNVEAQVFNLKNKVSYELFEDFDVSAGFDFSKGFGLHEFDNYSIIGEVGLFKPGLLRWTLGLRHTEFYDLGEPMETVYLRVFAFM